VNITNALHQLAAAGIPLLLAITLHEAAHAYTAFRLGDSTAKKLNRISINPIKHIDPIGTILLPLILVLLPTPFIFGWAKPVPINYNNLKKPRRDVALVALAGPMANLIMLIGWAILLKTLNYHLNISQNNIYSFAHIIAMYGIIINLTLLILNLLPIPPLDGSKVLYSLLPTNKAKQYEKIAPYGLFIIYILIATQVFQHILNPALNFVIQTIYN
jgi:Zn-dependent protease